MEDRLAPATFQVTTVADVVDPADGKLSLREAISRANATPGRDTIVLGPSTYKIAIPYNPGNPDVNATGSFDILGSLTLAGAGASKTVIDGAQIDRVFAVTGSRPGSINVLFRGLTVTGGKVGGDGGGILMGNANLTLTDCAVRGNQAVYNADVGSGGGISNALARGTGNLTLSRTTVSDNVASSDGGGIYLARNAQGQGSTLRIFDSTVLRNTAVFYGGGIFAGALDLTNTTVGDNRSTRATGVGGGIYASSGALTDCTVTGNSVAGNGGGLWAYKIALTRCTVSHNKAEISGGGIEANTSASLLDCTVSHNDAYFGGGIEADTVTLIDSAVFANTARDDGGGVWAETANLINTTVSGNTAAGAGGGIFAAAMSLLNCTIMRNQASEGGGVVHSFTDPATVRNTIITLNHATKGPAAGYDVVGDFISLGHNLIGDGAASTGFGRNSDLVGTSQNAIDPKLGALQDNGGRTFTHALLAGSPAIDKGDNTGAPARDQRGVKRARDGDGDGKRVVDIGAYER